jgi:hypothetical protein
MVVVERARNHLDLEFPWTVADLAAVSVTIPSPPFERAPHRCSDCSVVDFADHVVRRRVNV